MTLIEWRDEYSTGISGVDHEHQELINLINTAYEMLGDTADKKGIISCLGDIYGSISSHFALEERWMEQHNYDDYEAIEPITSACWTRSAKSPMKLKPVQSLIPNDYASV